MYTLENFYKSDKWIALLKALRAERVDENGDIICEHCGKTIIKAYDCIGHHKEMLTEENVNDYDISLNPENIALVHHRCHNEIHERFGYQGSRKVYLVYGAPCSGKSTYVKNVAGRNDIVLDIDRIWECISANKRYVKPAALKANVFQLRDCILDMIKTRTGKWQHAYVIGGYPMEAERSRLCQTLGAEEIFVEEDKEICLARAKEDGREKWEKYIIDWFERYTA